MSTTLYIHIVDSREREREDLSVRIWTAEGMAPPWDASKTGASKRICCACEEYLCYLPRFRWSKNYGKRPHLRHPRPSEAIRSSCSVVGVSRGGNIVRFQSHRDQQNVWIFHSYILNTVRGVFGRDYSRIRQSRAAPPLYRLCTGVYSPVKAQERSYIVADMVAP